jgi:hypothetical protein
MVWCMTINLIVGAEGLRIAQFLGLILSRNCHFLIEVWFIISLKIGNIASYT